MKQLSLFTICFAVFVLVVGTGMVAPVLAPYATSLGASGVMVGALYSGFYVVRLICGSRIGKFGDRQGPKTVLTVSLLLYPLIAGLYWAAASAPGLLAGRLVHGLASAMMLPMAMAYIGSIAEVGKEGRYMGIYNTVLFAANGVGPLIGGFAVERYGPKAAFIALFALAIISLLVTWLALPTVSSKKKEAPKADGQAAPVAEVAAVPFYKTPAVLRLSVINFVSAVLSIFFVSFFTIYAAKRGLSPAVIGGLLALNNVAIALAQPPLGRLVDKVNRGHVVIISGIATACLLLVFPACSSAVSIGALMVIVGIVSGATLAASSALSVEVGRTIGMGSAMGVLSSATSAGMVAGPLASGLLLQIYRVDVTFYFCAAIWAVGTFAFLLLGRVPGARLATVNS
ncbi:MFS transporter [Vogesella fluminis]|uniref:MFS transporter n=1 Tax=Vogesella fluminis TaxID=1069161 RepID=UPI0016753D1F|nr:MFS transporter [Vogesella fluminis]